MNVEGFMELHDGRTDAFGTGAGGWLHRPPRRSDFEAHLRGEGAGIGIAPLLDDGTCRFAAIDLDEPDFDKAADMAELLPGMSWIEVSRSGNAHVWAFFTVPIEAWIPRGIMREATAAVGRRTIEVFPKQDHLQPGMVGNYINLSYHGTDRPVLDVTDVDDFVERALAARSEPAEWRKRARWLNIASPKAREVNGDRSFGEQPTLHRCADWIIANRDTNPIVAGHRSVVYFSVAKMILNTEGWTEDEALDVIRSLDEASPDRAPDSELRRIVANAARGRFTSTGCDDALVLPYADPDCPIAFPR